MDILEKKIEANSFLPKLALAYLRQEIGFADLLAFFQHYRHLYSIGIDTNAVCNLQCGYCYLDKYVLKRGGKYAPLEAYMRAVDQLVKTGTDLVALVGKEPFADSRGITLLQHFDQLKRVGMSFRFGLVTNGVLADRHIDQIPSTINYIDISLDGPRDINDEARGTGVYNKATKNARLLSDRGFEIWISAVLHRGMRSPGIVSRFVTELVEKFGISRFYFSPIRNFTGDLQPFLLSYSEIGALQDELLNTSEKIRGLKTVILDHPYEAVWRDYLFPYIDKPDLILDRLYVDGFGVVFEPLSSCVIRKLDIFPHSPWGTARLDAFGNYLSDVEARTYETPPSIGNIAVEPDLLMLQMKAMETSLACMLNSFLNNMRNAWMAKRERKALLSVSIPLDSSSRRNIQQTSKH